MKATLIHDDVLEGADEFLFLSQGQHSVQQLYTGEKPATPDSVGVFLKNMRRRQLVCTTKSALFRACIFPDKMVALKDLLDVGAPLASLYLRNYRDAVERERSLPVEYPIDVLDGQKSCFTRTDTHYSGVGCAEVVARLLAKDFPELEQAFRERAADMVSRPATFTGDLGRKLTPPRSEDDATVLVGRARHKLTRATNGVHNNDGLMILQRSQASLTDKTLMIFGDSFFRQTLPLFGIPFRNVIFCRTRFFHEELIDAFAPAVVYYGQAERYLSRCFPDSDRPHFLGYAWTRGRALDPEPEFPLLWSMMANEAKLL